MRRWFAALALLGLGACMPPDTHARAEQNWMMCQGGAFPATQMAACSSVAQDERVDSERRAAAFVQRGVLREQSGQAERAIADYGRALRLDPRNANAYMQRGIAHQQRGAMEIALRDFNAALAINPSLAAAAQQRDAALRGQVQTFAVRLDQLNQILTRDPTNAGALNSRCWLRATNHDDLRDALADCDASLRVRPNDANTLDSRGFVHLLRGETAAAESDYAAAVHLEPHNAHFLYGLGVAMTRSGDAAKGRTTMDEAMSIDPDIDDEYASFGI